MKRELITQKDIMGEQIVMCIYKEHLEREIMQERARKEKKIKEIRLNICYRLK